MLLGYCKEIRSAYGEGVCAAKPTIFRVCLRKLGQEDAAKRTTMSIKITDPWMRDGGEIEMEIDHLLQICL
jgi:hypothetical protein